ncbi:hypothetical protein 7S2_40 [uncultured Caudovirales phage]|uniref:Helix-turn-helix domain-containing protein n=1 Tax=uncultured Caudovirales phage TaxID=2100421 RepID=A0A2H4JDC4_9CAUD|nr:hypothetical protein 7S2_40 [uncultured Caudovirales phage]
MRSTKLPVSLLTVDQVAERLAVSARTVGRMYRTGEIPHVRVRGAIRISNRDVEQYIENHHHVTAR